MSVTQKIEPLLPPQSKRGEKSRLVAPAAGR